MAGGDTVLESFVAHAALFQQFGARNRPTELR
jgi:hypothetical protein